LRYTLLRAAQARLFRPHWSAEILAEVERNLVEQGRASELQAARLVAVLREHFPDAEVAGYQPLIAVMTNSPKDRHVAAAAVRAGARSIVTANLRDFPAADLTPFGIRALTPDEVLLDLFDAAPSTILRLLEEQAAALRRPTLTVANVLQGLRRDAPAFVAIVEAVRG
jgi:hypothetical protein